MVECGYVEKIAGQLRRYADLLPNLFIVGIFFVYSATFPRVFYRIAYVCMCMCIYLGVFLLSFVSKLYWIGARIALISLVAVLYPLFLYAILKVSPARHGQLFIVFALRFILVIIIQTCTRFHRVHRQSPLFSPPTLTSTAGKSPQHSCMGLSQCS
jgi:hypothetical protein